MKLRQPETLRVLDHHDRGVGHVHPDLDHRGGHQDVDLAGAEAAHGLFTLLAGEAPVQRLQTPPPEVPLRQRVEVGVDVGEPQVRLVDHRHHDVRLLAGGETPGDLAIHLVCRRELADLRRHRLAARRHCPNGRDVQVAENRQRQRPGDGGGGHDEHVRQGPLVVSLAPQRRPLVHTEAVLLVDDGQGEALEAHVLGEQGVGADEQVDLAGLETLDHHAAL